MKFLIGLAFTWGAFTFFRHDVAYGICGIALGIYMLRHEISAFIRR